MKRNIIKLRQGSAYIEREDQEEKKEKEDPQANKLLSEALGLGFIIALPIAGGAILGAALDKGFGTAPKLTLGFIFFGLFISIVKLIQITLSGQNNTK